MKNLILILVAALLPVAGAAEPPEPYRVGVLYWSMNIPGQVVMRQGLEREAERLNAAAAADGSPGMVLLPHVAGDGEPGKERQIAQMLGLVAAGVDLIVVQPTDNAALAQPLRAANAAGIPVVAYDQYISGGHLTAYVTSDNYQAGYLAGEYTAWRLDGPRPLRLVLLEYPHVSSTIERVDGFLDGLRDQGRAYDILASFEAVEPEGGRRAARELLARFPEPGSIDAVFAVNDGGGLALVEALAQAGRTEIFVASTDGDPRALENVRRGRLSGIDSAQFCAELGARALRTGHRALRGEPVPAVSYVPAFPVTRETLERFGGWDGPVAKSFDKPWPSRRPRWGARTPDA